MPERVGEFHFRPSARLQNFLGRELIADPNLAVIEFVKNAYDAGATSVLVRFTLAEDPTSLLIADNGEGMTPSTFEKNWMHPGFSTKADGEPQHGRTPAGEKGIGRLAAGRLGDELEIFTRRSPRQPWLHVRFVWSDFDTMRKHLDEIPVRYDTDTDPEEAPYDTGTIIVIRELSLRWDHKLRGRPQRGRPTSRLGRLKQDLSFVVRNVPSAEFEVALESDMVRGPNDVGVITAESAAEEAGYVYRFTYSGNGDGASIRRQWRRSPEIARLVERPGQDPPEEVQIAQVANAEGRPDTLSCGPFSGVFLYNPPPAAQRAKEVDQSPVGVLLYRDGILVEPYGLDDDDWLGVRARKAQRQGYAVIQPDTFSGHVDISRKDNPRLRDMTNRLGLLDSEQSQNFFDHIRAEVRRFERQLYAELLEPRFEGNREKRARAQAAQTAERMTIALRSLAHSLRQPLFGLGLELVTFEAVERRDDIPDDVAKMLREARERAEAHLREAEALVDQFLGLEIPDFEEVPLRVVVQEAVAHTDALADTRRAAVDIDEIPDATLLVPRQLSAQTLAALIGNALEAERPNGRAPRVELQFDVGQRHVEVRVEDNGTGIDGVTPETPLASIGSTKGRPPVGLRTAELSATAMGGRLSLLTTSGSGTTFALSLPTKVGGVEVP